MGVGLNTRQHARAALEMAVTIQVHMNHRSQVDLMGQSQDRAAHTWDISMGGLAVETETFLPRGTAVEVVFDRLPRWGGGAPEEPSPMTVLGRVQRCSMVSCRPSYLLAISFLEMGDRMRQAVDDYVEAWGQTKAPLTPQSQKQ